jgi:PKD repeat protein
MKESRGIGKTFMEVFFIVAIFIFLFAGIASAPQGKKASGDRGDMTFFVNTIQQTVDNKYVSLDHSTFSDNMATSLSDKKGDADLSGGTSTDWLATVQEGIQKSEYSMTWKEQTYLPDIKAAYQAPNRAHNMRTYFTRDGIRVIPRTSTNPDWTWGLSLKGFGYEGELQPVVPSKLSVSGNRIEYKRGNITEWYVNDERGIEQGFSIQKPPESERQHESKVVLNLDIYGDLNGTLNSLANSVEFSTAGGVGAMRYSELHAFDAGGRELPAKFALTGKVIDILVDASDALYPITVDPIATSPSWTAEGNQGEAWFGFSVGTAGDVNGDGYSDVIVSAIWYDNGESDEGRVYVYYGSGSGLSPTANWTAEGNQAGAEFGCSVGTAGDVNGDGYSDVIIGARSYSNGESKEGRAFVYYGSASGLSTSANWTAESNHADANFGYSVGTAGDVNGDGYSDIIIGAPHYTGTDTDVSKAYVYYGSASGLNPSAAWMAENTQASARFGWSVATAGDVNHDGYSDVIVGAPYFDNGQTDEGKAFVYHGSASGLSTSPNWTAESNQTPEYGGAQFGWSVATAGDVNGDGYDDVIIGANNSSYDYYPDPTECPDYYYHDVHGGKTYVYYGSASGLSTSPSWTAGGDRPSAEFGISAGTAGDVNGDGYSDIIVGAWLRGFPGFSDRGAAYIYYGSASGLSTSFDWRVGADSVAGLGYSVGTAGDVNGDGYIDVIVGVPGYSDGHTGRVYVYYGCATGTSTKAAWMVQSDQAGSSVHTAGDVNGDGYSDVIVGVPHYDNGETDEGKVFVYQGSASGLSTTAAWTAEGNQANARFGSSVNTAGDVNGDGFSDIIVGAYSYNNGKTGAGKVFVYHGSSSGLGTAPNWTAEGSQAYEGLGWSIGTAGDVNGDGYADVIVSGGGYFTGLTRVDKAFVYYGSASGLGTSPQWTAESVEAVANCTVGTAGDVNGDGYSDAVFGTSYFDGTNFSLLALVYYGSASGLSPTANWTASYQAGTLDSAYAATCVVGTAGDVNGDGYSDLLVGVRYWDEWWGQEGWVSVYHGSASGLSTSANWSVVGPHSVAFGNPAGTAGDVNGDGYSDIFVGAYYYTHLEAHEGKVFVYHGSSSGLSTALNWTAEGGREYAYFGSSAGTAGDVNGDGYSDVIVGANHWKPCLEGSTGVAYVYHGSPSGLLFRPAANFTATPTSGDKPLQVTFTDQSTGNVSSWAWDFDNDGTIDSTEQNPSHTYSSAGDYTVSLTIIGQGGKDTEVKENYIHVTAPPTIGYSPTSFSFTATQGGSNPSNKTLSISNTGGGTLNWNVNDDALWLSLNPTSGTNSATVTLSVSIAGLTPGTYNATITITAAGATNSPVSIPVTLTINAPTTALTLVSPNGGEVIPSGSTYTIQWNAPPTAVKFTLKYSINNGSKWKLIAKNRTGTSYNWTVPVQKNNKKNCLVKVISFNSSGTKVGEDISDSTFTIEVVKVTSPDGGETLTSGNTYAITWTTNGTIRPVTSTKLFYTINGGSKWIVIKTLTGNPGTYNWTVPSASSSNCKVKVVLKDAGGKTVGNDISDGLFTIQL